MNSKMLVIAWSRQTSNLVVISGLPIPGEGAPDHLNKVRACPGYRTWRVALTGHERYGDVSRVRELVLPGLNPARRARLVNRMLSGYRAGSSYVSTTTSATRPVSDGLGASKC